MATKTDRLGETRMMNCDMDATIIRYGNNKDIDVRFKKSGGNSRLLVAEMKARLSGSLDTLYV